MSSAALGHTGAWQSLSGVRLEGTALTRAVYMDESGTSHGEPCLAVAAVIVHADRQLGRVEDALREIIDTFIPERCRDGFVLHASDLFSGDEKTLPPEIWEQSIRWAALQAVLSIPKKLGIPLC